MKQLLYCDDIMTFCTEDMKIKNKTWTEAVIFGIIKTEDDIVLNIA